MKNTSDLFNEIIPLGRLIYMVNQKKDRLLNDYLSPLDITASQFKVLCSIRCAVCITPVELKKVLSVDLGALTREQTRALQTALSQRGFATGAADGVMGPATRAGLRQYQQSQGLAADGYPTLELLQRLQAGNPSQKQ